MSKDPKNKNAITTLWMPLVVVLMLTQHLTCAAMETSPSTAFVINQVQSNHPSSHVLSYFRSFGCNDESRIVPCQLQGQPLYPLALAKTETTWCYLPPDSVTDDFKELGQGPNLDRIMPLKMCSQLSLNDKLVKTVQDDQGRDWVWCPFQKYAPL